VLKEGDLLKVDCGVEYKGMISDAAFSIVVGGDEKNPRAKKLHRATKDLLDKGINFFQPGKKLYDYGRFAKEFAKRKGISIIKNLAGH
jgi:methionyl aminopeptidase